MVKLSLLLHNRNVIFLLAMAAGLTAHHATPLTRHFVLPALALAMTISMLDIQGNLFSKPRTLFFPVLIGIFMNYVILGNVIIGISALFIRDESLWTGFVLLAAAPPAIAVIPFSGFLGGNSLLSLIGTIGAYLGALAIMPLIDFGLLGSASLDPMKLLTITAELIVLPLAISRWLIRKGWNKRILPLGSLITNWSFFLVLYTLIGMNRNLILGQSQTLLPVIAVAFLTMFILGFLIDWIAGLLHISKETRTSLVLLGTLKNQGLAGGLALTLFNQEAALPAAISTMVMIFYIICLDFRKSGKIPAL
jgi:BASS family bile acid:Na+ symporter